MNGPANGLTRRRWLQSCGRWTVGASALHLGWLGCRRADAAEERVLEQAQSQYNHVVVTERGSVRTMYFVVDDTWYIESRWDRSFPRSLDLDYTRTMMAGFLVQPKVRRLLMIGFGGGQISNYLFDRFPQLEIDAVDIDGEVIRLARKHFGVPNDPRYRTHTADGRLFIENAAGQTWDMIMLDAFRGVFVPYHLKTREFYRACASRLTADGVVVANLHNGTRMYPHDRETLAAVFPQRYGFWSESRRQSTYVGGAATRPVGVYGMRANARALQSHFDFDLLGLAARYYTRADWRRGAEVLRDDFSPEELERAIERHNANCDGECSYDTR